MADDSEPVGIDASVDNVLHDSVALFVAQVVIVLAGRLAVGVRRDLDHGVGIEAQCSGHLIKRGASAG